MLGGKNRRHNVANTIIGKDTQINGDVHFSGGLHVDGTINGGVSADPDSKSALTLAKGATIDGGVTVPFVLLEGTVQGDVFANKRVMLGSTARVIGNVYYNLIEMTIGAEINGKLVHQPEGQVPLLQQTQRLDEQDRNDDEPVAFAGEI